MACGTSPPFGIYRYRNCGKFEKKWQEAPFWSGYHQCSDIIIYLFIYINLVCCRRVCCPIVFRRLLNVFVLRMSSKLRWQRSQLTLRKYLSRAVSNTKVAYLEDR